MDALNEKEDTRPSSADGLRSTKKVRIRSDEMEGGKVEGMAEPDVVMAEKEDGGGSSYRNKLLNLSDGGKGKQSLPEVVISDNDFLISSDGDIPTIDFSKEVRDVLARGMERTLVIKMLGRSASYFDLLNRTRTLWWLRGSFQLVDVEGGFFFASFDLEEDYMKVLTGGPWMIYGAYITVQPWSMAFDPKTAILSNAVVWIRISGLSFRYYRKSTLRAIGRLLGEVIKIDYTTETRERGRYARIAVLVDLQKPLVPWIKVDCRMYGVEYEGLPLICFECGRIGHAKEKCPLRKPVIISAALVSEAILVDGSPGGESEGECSMSSGGRLPEPGAAPFGGESRFNILFDCEDVEASVKAPFKENGGRYKGKGIGSRIVRNSTAELVSKEAESPSSVKRQPKHSQIKPKVRVQEYRLKPHQEGPSSITKPNSMEVLISPSGPSTLAGDVVMDKSPMETILISNPEGAGSDKNSSMESPVPVPTPIATTLDSSRHTVVELRQPRPALTEVKQIEANFSKGQHLVKKGVGGSQKGKENMKANHMDPTRGQHGVNLRSSSAKSLKVRKKSSGSHISKDAIAVLNEELVSPHELAVAPVCSSVDTLPVQR
ncbi:hypothetical protein K1719_028125 [Acacia pycnantha]|nr:hypothetical protein K1719_028125 [Acacia pycnantha]